MKRATPNTQAPSRSAKPKNDDVSASRLLNAKQEVALAELIRTSDHNTWVEVLSFAPALHWCLERIETFLDKPEKSFKSARRAATRYLRKRDDKSHASLIRAARRTAVDLRALDLDRNHITSMMNALAKADTSSNESLPFNTTPDAFLAYRERISEKARIALAHRQTFIQANFGLVVSVAKRYRNSGMDFQDLIQEGNLGLIKAVDRFDHERGFRFSTYATWWIRHAVGRSVSDKSRLVRVPVHLLEVQQKIGRVTSELSQKLERTPTPAEIATKTGLPLAKILDAQQHTFGLVKSLDAPVHESDAGRSRGEKFVAPDDNSTRFAKTIENQSVMSKIKSLMRHLKPVEVDIINQRFGLDGGDGATLQEIANGFGLSRERVRQIQNRALDKVRGGLTAEMAA